MQFEEGRVLCACGDDGYRELVQQGKYRDGRFCDELVSAVVEMIYQFNPSPKPSWITCVPSIRYPNLVPDFAYRLAAALHLPFYRVLSRTDNRPEQKTMANSHQKAHNLDGAFAISEKVLKQPCFLIDDTVDSRWTFTVCAHLLRKAGATAVFPIALADAGK